MSPLDAGINKNIHQQRRYFSSRHLRPFLTSGTYMPIQLACHEIHGHKSRFLYIGPTLIAAIA
jgi:hypothetical protein